MDRDVKTGEVWELSDPYVSGKVDIVYVLRRSNALVPFYEVIDLMGGVKTTILETTLTHAERSRRIA